MCVALPGKIIKIEEETGIAVAEVKSDEKTRKISVAMLENPKIGDWVLIHDDLALSRITAEEAVENQQIYQDSVKHHSHC
jgi:hydrogenase expression/formation protein HypC